MLWQGEQCNTVRNCSCMPALHHRTASRWAGQPSTSQQWPALPTMRARGREGMCGVVATARHPPVSSKPSRLPAHRYMNLQSPDTMSPLLGQAVLLVLVRRLQQRSRGGGSRVSAWLAMRWRNCIHYAYHRFHLPSQMKGPRQLASTEWTSAIVYAGRDRS